MREFVYKQRLTPQHLCVIANAIGTIGIPIQKCTRVELLVRTTRSAF